jgi:sulfite exporter TauE/SafE
LPPVPTRTRAFAAVGAGLLLLALNVLDAADRGTSAGNIVAIACGAFLLFWGFAMVARTGPPPSA